MKRLMLCLMLTLLPLPARAEMEIITLQHRSLEEVLPVIRPMLDPDGAASGMNNTLILRTSARNLAEIRKMLESIDSAPRRLKITVLQNIDREAAARLIEASGSVGVGGDARVTVPLRARGGGLSVEAAQGEDRLHARLLGARALEDDRKAQHLQVLEGNRAYIQTGETMPIPQRQIVRSPYAQVIDTTTYRDATSGFYVLPRVSGDRVTLEISTQNDRLSTDRHAYPTPRIQSVATTVSGRLGEWLAVGDIGQQQQSSGATITSRSNSSTSEECNVLLKVEEVK